MTVTIITFVVGVLAFRRMTRDYPSVVPALGDVLRVALFVALPLFVGSLVFRSDLDELGGGWIAEAAKDVSNGDSASWGVSAPSALFVSFALVAFVLALACLARRDWWPGAGRTVAEWLSPAIQGVALLAAVLPLCGLVGIGLLTLGPDNDADLHESTSDEDWAIIAVLAGGLGNGGQALLGLGAGAELGAAGEFETTTEFGGDDETDEEFHRLAFFAGDEGEEPALWAAPVVLLVVLAACAVLVASRSRDRTQVVRDLAVWCALLLVAVPWLIRLANLHGSGTYDFDGGDEGFSGKPSSTVSWAWRAARRRSSSSSSRSSSPSFRPRPRRPEACGCPRFRTAPAEPGRPPPRRGTRHLRRMTDRLPALELGLPLLQEGPRALLGVVGGEDGGADLGVVGPAVLLVLALGVAHRLEDRLDGERAVGGDHVGELVGLGERLAVRDDVADEPELLGLGRERVRPVSSSSAATV